MNPPTHQRPLPQAIRPRRRHGGTLHPLAAAGASHPKFPLRPPRVDLRTRLIPRMRPILPTHLIMVEVGALLITSSIPITGYSPCLILRFLWISIDSFLHSGCRNEVPLIMPRCGSGWTLVPDRRYVLTGRNKLILGA